MAVRIRAALVEQGLDDACFLGQYPPAGAMAGLRTQHGCNICFLDTASDPERAMLLVSEAARNLQVVAMNPRKDADLILQCLRLGACEFLSDASAEEVGRLLERLARHLEPADAAAPSTVICVMPGKPGCGASTLATYLAIEMKRCGMRRVLLVDTDPISSSVAFLLKLKPAFHLGDAVRDWNRMDDDLWARLAVACHGIDVLPAPDDPTIRVEIQPRAALGLLAFWRKHYDAILLDVAGAHSAGCEFAPVADHVLLVTSNELAALHAARRSMECLEKNTVEAARRRLVVTRYTPAIGLKREGIEAALKTPPFAYLGNDWDAVQRALVDGKPVDPDSHFGRSIRALAERLMGKDKPGKKRSGLFALLSPGK
jgi:Flp pilus assembly CpaE family ATPase